MSFPSDCRYGLKYSYNVLSPDLSTILPTLQAYGYGYCAGSYTDAYGLHIVYARPSGYPLEYPAVSNVFGTLDFNCDFESSFDIRFVSIDYAFAFCFWRIKFVSVLSNLDYYGRVGYAANSGISFTASPNSMVKNIPYITDGNWYNVMIKKNGSRLWGFINKAPAAYISWPGYSSTNGTVNIEVGTNNTSCRNFAFDIKNLRVVTLTGTSCAGGDVNDLTKM
mgnify:FL=1